MKDNWLDLLLMLAIIVSMLILAATISGCGPGENSLVNLKPTRSYMARLNAETRADFRQQIEAETSKVRNTVNDLWPWMTLLGFGMLCGAAVAVAYIVRHENDRQLRLWKNGTH